MPFRTRRSVAPWRTLLVLLVLGGFLAGRAAAEGATALDGPAIVVDADADTMAQDGARDFRVYWYRMTGALLPVVPASSDLAMDDLSAGSFVFGRLGANPVLEGLQKQGELGLGRAKLGPEGFGLETIPVPNGTVTVVAASTGRGVMYGCYEMSFRGTLPASALQGEVIEYFVEVSSDDGRVLAELRYPRNTETVWMEPL